MSSSRGLKDALYEQVGRLAKSMANAKRLELIELLCQAPKSVETLADQANISVKLTSAHLKELRFAHIVETEKQGRQVIYSISCPEVAGLLVNLRTLATDRLFELQHALQQAAQSAEPWIQTDRETLLRRARRNEVTVVDVRPAKEFAERHLPYARSIPLPELARRLRDLPKDKPVVAYCRGPFCLMSAEAVTLLRKAGYEAYHWREGPADWLAGNTPTISEPSRG